jgi:hypothetical protein
VVEYVVYTGLRENQQMLRDNKNSSVALAMCLLPSLKLHHFTRNFKRTNEERGNLYESFNVL